MFHCFYLIPRKTYSIIKQHSWPPKIYFAPPKPYNLATGLAVTSVMWLDRAIMLDSAMQLSSSAGCKCNTKCEWTRYFLGERSLDMHLSAPLRQILIRSMQYVLVALEASMLQDFNKKYNFAFWMPGSSEIPLLSALPWMLVNLSYSGAPYFDFENSAYPSYVLNVISVSNHLNQSF